MMTATSNTNLLEETLEVLSRHGYTDPFEQVIWVGSDNGHYAMNWGSFSRIAKDVNYDSDFGLAEIYTELVIIMNDGSWFSRGEYDGKEWWDYNTCPKRRLDSIPFKLVNKQKYAFGDNKPYANSWEIEEK